MSARTRIFKGSVTVALLALFSFLAPVIRAGVGGSISGSVKDATGAAIPRAAVAATNTSTGVRQTTSSDDRGSYSFLSLPIGSYDIEVTSPGFKPYRRTGVVIDANSALIVDASLEVGENNETVTVSDAAVHVEAISSQMGQVVTGKQMTAVPLNGAASPTCCLFSRAWCRSLRSPPTPCRMSARARFLLRAI